MADLKIRVFKNADPAPETTVTIPSGAVQLVKQFLESVDWRGRS